MNIMTATTLVPHRIATSPVSLRARSFRVVRWLLALSLITTLFIGLIRYPIERTAIDPSAPNGESDYVSVRGLPHFYFVSDSSVMRSPAASVLFSHFLQDWLAFFIIFAVPVFGIEGIRLVAFVAARSFRSASQ
jgi:hypothetical protein